MKPLFWKIIIGKAEENISIFCGASSDFIEYKTKPAFLKIECKGKSLLLELFLHGKFGESMKYRLIKDREAYGFYCYFYGANFQVKFTFPEPNTNFSSLYICGFMSIFVFLDNNTRSNSCSRSYTLNFKLYFPG